MQNTEEKGESVDSEGLTVEDVGLGDDGNRSGGLTVSSDELHVNKHKEQWTSVHQPVCFWVNRSG